MLGERCNGVPARHSPPLPPRASAPTVEPIDVALPEFVTSTAQGTPLDSREARYQTVVPPWSSPKHFVPPCPSDVG